MFRFVDIEATSHCNAKCPFCNRTNMKNFKAKHLDLHVIQRLPFEKIKNVLMLGNKGDAIFYPKLFELIEYIHNFKCWISIHTNASIHNDMWWMELAKLLKGKGNVVYAIDGLEDTHSLHRVGTDFNKVVRNITKFNEAGGRSTAQFIKFKENEHQEDAVRELVRLMGSKNIWIRKSRNFNNVLHRPTGAKTRHELNKESKKEIKCVFLDPSFVLTIDGEVRPCCFMADDDYKANFKTHLIEDIKHPQHLIAYLSDPKMINLKYNTFDEIMDSRYYKWIRSNYKNLFRCNQKCKATFNDIVDRECL